MDRLEAHMLEALMEQAGIGVATCDAHGRLTRLSPALEHLVDRPYAPVEEPEYVDYFALRDANDRPLPREQVPLLRARYGETVRDALLTVRLRNGRSAYLRCNAAPLRDPRGRLLGAIACVQDVTAERAAEAEQTLLRRRLIDIVKHEFRTPLTSLVGHVELLEDRTDQLPATVEGQLRRICRAGRGSPPGSRRCSTATSWPARCTRWSTTR